MIVRLPAMLMTAATGTVGTIALRTDKAGVTHIACLPGQGKGRGPRNPKLPETMMKGPSPRHCPCAAWGAADAKWQSFPEEVKAEIRKRTTCRHMSAYDHYMKWACRRLNRGLKVPPWPPEGWSWSRVDRIPDEVWAGEGYPEGSALDLPPECRGVGFVALWWQRWKYHDTISGKMKSCLVAAWGTVVDPDQRDWAAPYYCQYGWHNPDNPEEGELGDIEETVAGSDDYRCCPEASYPAVMDLSLWNSMPIEETPEFRERDPGSERTYELGEGGIVINMRPKVEGAIDWKDWTPPEICKDPAELTGQKADFEEY